MLIGLEMNREDLIYKDDKKKRTEDFPNLYKGILELFYPDVPKYSDFVEIYHRDRSIYQHGLEHLDLKTIKKPSVMEYIKFVEQIMKKVGYLGKAETIQPISITPNYSYNNDYQKNQLEEKFKQLYNRLTSDDLEHIHIDMNTTLEDIGNRNLQKVLKMEYRKLNYGDSMLNEHYKWNLTLNHTFHKRLSISKQDEGSYNFSEPDKNREILQEFLDILKKRFRDAGLDIS